MIQIPTESIISQEKRDAADRLMGDALSRLKKLREPFPDNQISKLPKPTKQQTDEVKNDYKKGERCGICGGWHHPRVVHLDYVGHAALTDRLLDVDPLWTWEPPTKDELERLPVLPKDQGIGMWIKLTVCGMSRFGYGDATGKSGGDGMKEIIGDALRNAAMRFGCALDLWHKGDLHAHLEEGDEQPAKEVKVEPKKEPPAPKGWLSHDDLDIALTAMGECDNFNDLKDVYGPAWSHGTKEQKAVLQTAYESRKAAKGWA